MRNVICDQCNFTTPTSGASRIRDWCHVVITKREWDPNHDRDHTVAREWELCPSCTTELEMTFKAAP